MRRLLLICALFSLGECSPILGNLNAEAHDQGNSTVSVDNDVILTPGQGGHNFNAESDTNGHSVVQIGGKVHGSVNRVGQEFNAKSASRGSSQVLITGELDLEGLAPNSQKFNAVSESGGQSLVQVGNVQVISGARQARLVNDIRDTQDDNPHLRKAHKKHDRDDLGAGWGAIAVAEHNSRPWEDIEEDLNGDQIHVSDIFDDDQSLEPNDQFRPPIGSEIHDFPHQGNLTQVDVDGAEASTHTPIIVVPSSDHGNLNAVSHGYGSTSLVKVLGSVQI